jgi:large subunit ribosomal protein L4
MFISVIDFNSKKEKERISVPENIAIYKDASTKSISKVHFVSKKISFVKTANTKGMSDVSGTTKKPFKQKGTGNARSGSLRAPQYRGGGVVFGPKPITATYKINKKEKIHAKKVLIAKLIDSNCITVVDSLPIPHYNTKGAIAAVNSLNIQGKFAIIHNNELAYESLKSLSNLIHVGAYSVENFHLYEIVKYDNIVFTKSAFEQFISSVS